LDAPADSTARFMPPKNWRSTLKTITPLQLFFSTSNRTTSREMTKTQCKKDDYKEKDDAKYLCKRCGRTSKKEEKVCKPKKLKD
jgi:hypothetical protein